MSFSRAEFRTAFGASLATARCETLLVFVTSAGDPTGTVKPDFIGQECFDSANLRFYKAVGVNAADWRAMTA